MKDMKSIIRSIRIMGEKRFDYIWKDVKDDRGLSEIHDFFIDNFSNKEYDLSYEEDIGYFLDLLDRLSEKNEQLKEINKEIGDDLHNCRLNKNIISEKLKLWQDTLAEYDIYTIKDFEESFKLDAKINKEKDEKIKELEVKVLNLELELMKNE